MRPVALLVAALLPAFTWAHAGLDVRIKALDAEIRAAPRNAALHLKRGELHRLHRDWQAAAADYTRAGELDSRLAEVHLARGRMLLESGQPQAAIAALSQYLKQQPGRSDALLVRARAHTRAGDHLAAARDYDEAIAGLEQPTPEYFLERARALLAAGPAQAEAALAGLEQGMRALGPVIALLELAIEIDTGLGRLEAALQRFSALPAALQQVPEWTVRRADLLARQGAVDAAEAAYRQTLAQIASLPPARRDSPMMRALHERAESGLNELKRPPLAVSRAANEG